MRPACTSVLATVTLVALVAMPPAASATHENDPRTRNLHPKGEALRPASIAANTANSDLAFSGRYAFQGSYDGFRIIDISDPDNPTEVTFFPCWGNQGDVAVFGNLLIRAANSPVTTDQCSAVPVPSSTPNFEGLQIIDISDVRNPRWIKSVPVDCGAHTHTLVPDLENNRVLVYVSSSGSSTLGPSPFGNNCTATHGHIPVVAIPLDDPTAASVIGEAMLTDPSGNTNVHCHDIGAILGDVNKALCAGNPRMMVMDISDPASPMVEHSFTYVPTAAERQLPSGAPNPDARNLGNWHSAAFTWDGKVLLSGWEPGGGSAPECESDDPAYEKSIYFWSAETRALLGRWTLPRGQDGAGENCTIHNFNVLPLRDRYVLVVGNYQAGTSVVDFTDPANAYEVAYSDPPVLSPPTLGGAWSSYWYNNFIYESDITRGLRVYRLSDRVAAGAMRLPYLNPQTQDFTLPAPKGKE